MSASGPCSSPQSPPWCLAFLWYSPTLFARPWMVAMGYDPDDKARMEEVAEERRQKSCDLFCRQPRIGLRPGQESFTSRPSTARLVRDESRLSPIWLGLRDHGASGTAKLFGNQSTKLYLINTGYQLARYLAIGSDFSGGLAPVGSVVSRRPPAGPQSAGMDAARRPAAATRDRSLHHHAAGQ